MDLYTTYCLNYERASQCAAAFEKDRIQAQWISAYNRQLNLLETSTLTGTRAGSANDLKRAASVHRVGSCITFDSSSPTGSSTPKENGAENEENLPPPARKASQQQQPPGKASSLSRPLLSYSSRLLEPAQRFQRYHLLIDRLRKYAPDGPQK